ncbi:MAG: hypothetical protein ABIH11_04055 [Candidatus Altiarchaeota archaeon]
MFELMLRLFLVLLVWLDALTTYLFLRKARDYGHPHWVDEETSPVYRRFINKYGLNRGVLMVAAINPLIFIALTRLVVGILDYSASTEFSLGMGYGIFYGMILISAYRNYYVYYKCPAEKYNEKVLGRPCIK